MLAPTLAFRIRPASKSDKLRSQMIKAFSLGLARDLATSLVVSWLIWDAYKEGIKITGK